MYFKSSSLVLSSHFLILYISFLFLLVLVSFGIVPSTDFGSLFSAGFKAFKAPTCFIPWFPIVYICFSNDLPRGEYVNLACVTILFWLDGNIFHL